ncbi:hypothetical protein SteCoe_9211 [Stentor coeruleus]|uniref:Uncharacterized protein n=1 Tax=Stentor coeruleus TaxID=5963 RepID=A0A1R2CI92_9CILI|nr:hypothetical protein SteCoe_9211 [Stentor coeruleus]
MNSASPSRMRATPQSNYSNISQSFLSPNKSENIKSLQNSFDLKKNCYEKSCCGHISRAHYNNFLIDIQNEIKRLDSSIELNFDEKIVFNKVLSVIRQSVDYIMLIQNKFTNMDWVDLENFKSNLKLQEAKLKNESEKIRIASKHLDQYEMLLRGREEQLKSDEKELKSKLEETRKDDLYYEELKLKCIEQEQEIRILKKHKLSESILIESNLNSELEYLKTENTKLKLIISQKPTQSLDEKSVSENMPFDKEKFKLQQVRLEVSQIKESIEKEKARMKAQSLEIEKLSMPEPDAYENSLTLSDSSCNINQYKHYDYETKSKFLDIKESFSIQNESDLYNYLSKIRKGIEEYNKEAEIKETRLKDLILKNEEKEKILDKQIADMKLVHDNLRSSKIEIEEFYASIMPSFEEYSQDLSKLLADMYMKKQELVDNIVKTEKVLGCLGSNGYIKEEFVMEKCEYNDRILEIKKNHDNMRDYERNIKEKQGGRNKNMNEAVMKMTRELQNQLENIKKKEKEIDMIREQLELEKTENKKVAMMLKVTHLELENTKIKENEKIRIKKDKLKTLKIKLENHLKAFQGKDTDGQMRSSLGEHEVANVLHSLVGINEKNA